MHYKKRFNVILLIFFCFFLLLNAKFIYLQLIHHHKFYKGAASQRSASVKLADSRGIIYDRSLIPIVNENPVKYAVVFPESITNKKNTKQLLEKATGESNIASKLSSSKPFAKEIRKTSTALLEKLSKSNVLVLDSLQRYGNKNFARHIIGYTSVGHGRAGIEKAYDKFLYSSQGKYIGVVLDAVHHPINSLGVRYLDQKEFKGEFNVKLTLDYHIQKIVEESMDRNKIAGAVVALRVEDGDIVAMSSRPQFEQENVGKYINSDRSELVNRAISPYNTGSIFKIVVTAAALENGTATITDIFRCSGSKIIQGRSFRCSGLHGILDLPDAFSASCNSAFIDIGLRTGKDKMLNMARKFGFGGFTQLNELGINESKGKLPELKYTSDKEVANIAIGQGDILATPLQVASMAAVIANDGLKTEINLVDSIIDSDGKTIKKVKKVTKERIISRDTAAKIKAMMEKVTESGTGKKANIPQFGGAAGKTGTAQTGWVKDNQAKVHGWFVGYFPRKKPQYALVVFVENGQSGSKVAAPIFGEIASGIMKLGKR